MTKVLLGLGLLLAVGAVIAYYFVNRWMDSPDVEFEAGLDRYGLRPFKVQMYDDIAAHKRPVWHAQLLGAMIEVLDAVAATPPGQGQVALIEPPDPRFKAACEELVALGRLQRVQDGAAYLPVPRA